MKLSPLFQVLTLFLSIPIANASGRAHESWGRNIGRHNSLAQRDVTITSLSAETKVRKRCVKSSVAATPTTKAPKTTPTTKVPKTTPITKVAKTTPTLGAGTDNSKTGGVRLVSLQNDSCGGSRATTHTDNDSGPNGHIDWLNCGLTPSTKKGGWQPPSQLTLENMVSVELDTALEDPKSPFKQCRADLIALFNKYGAANKIPAIFLASFALQESTCNPDAPGGGLMQISSDKCGKAPGGNCNDPDYNVKTAASYFAQTIKDNNGNVIAAVGTYNGWYVGLTMSGATAAKNSGCCRCQNNLDYLHQFFNGWIQNINVYSNPPILHYNNLASCPDG